MFGWYTRLTSYLFDGPTKTALGEGYDDRCYSQEAFAFKNASSLRAIVLEQRPEAKDEEILAAEIRVATWLFQNAAKEVARGEWVGLTEVTLGMISLFAGLTPGTQFSVPFVGLGLAAMFDGLTCAERGMSVTSESLRGHRLVYERAKKDLEQCVRRGSLPPRALSALRAGS